MASRWSVTAPRLAGPPGSLQDYEDANVKATVRLARLAAESGVKTLVYVSSLSVYGLPEGVIRMWMRQHHTTTGPSSAESTRSEQAGG